MTAERFAEAALNTFAQRPEAAQWGEFKYLLGGVLPGITRGARNFMRTWRNEVSSFGESVHGKVEEPHTAIGGTWGRVVRAPQRMLLAVDDLFRTLASEMEVGAYAYRIAKGEKLTGDALRQRIAALHADPKSEAWAQSLASADELLFTEAGGPAVRGALGLRRTVPGLRYLIPFVTTPGNIFRLGIRKSPLGTFALPHAVAEAVRTGNWSKVTTRAAEQALAWGAVLALVGLTDPDDPWISGARGATQAKAKPGQGILQPMSIRLPGGSQFSYARIEPFATAIAGTVDMIEAVRSGSHARIASAPWETLVGQMSSKTFLQGIGDIIEATQSDSPDKAAKLASNFAIGWVPNIWRTGVRATEDARPQTRVWGKGWEWTERLALRTAQRAKVPGMSAEPTFDVWGRPMAAGTSPVPGTDILWRMFSPVQTFATQPFVGDVMIAAWNRQHPDDEHTPIFPSPTYQTVDKKPAYMTDAQYATFLRASGERAAAEVARYAATPGVDVNHPTEQDMKRIGSILSASRTVSREQIAKAESDAEAQTRMDEKMLHLRANNALRLVRERQPVDRTEVARAHAITRVLSVVSRVREGIKRGQVDRQTGAERIAGAVAYLKERIAASEGAAPAPQ